MFDLFHRFRGLRFPMLLIALAACSTELWAQGRGGRASLTGTVQDATGAVVPNATVTATNTATGVATTTKTNGEGAYTFIVLDVGNYTISVAAAGFKTQKTENIALNVDQQSLFNITLTLGQAGRNH